MKKVLLVLFGICCVLGSICGQALASGPKRGWVRLEREMVVTAEYKSPASKDCCYWILFGRDITNGTSYVLVVERDSGELKFPKGSRIKFNGFWGILLPEAVRDQVNIKRVLTASKMLFGKPPSAKGETFIEVVLTPQEDIKIVQKKPK